MQVVTRLTLIAAMVLALFLFVGLTDAGQFLDISNKAFVTIWHYRALLAGLALAALISAWGLHYFQHGLRSTKVLLTLSVIWFFFVGSALFLNSHILFMPQADPEKVTYVDFGTANAIFNDNEDMAVLIANGQTVAYPPSEIGSPHIAGFADDSENISFAYCGLSNLGVAFVTTESTDYLDLGVVGQSNNNLIVFDKRSGDTIQQISGKSALGDRKLEMRPTLRMSYGAYKKAFPEGKVFLNAEQRPFYRRIIIRSFWTIARYFMQKDDLPFPYQINNAALESKIQVYALDIEGSQVAYTKEFIVANNNLLNVLIGDHPIVLAYFEEYDAVAAFHGGNDISSVDFFGRSNAGPLQRVASLRSKVYWGVWQHYFPDTALNQI